MSFENSVDPDQLASGETWVEWKSEAQIRLVTKKIFSYFSTKTYVVGTQKNLLIEAVILSTQNICLKSWVRKYLQFYAENFCVNNL